MKQNYFVISQRGNRPPLLARFKWGSWKRKKDSLVCDVEMQIGSSIKFEKEEGEPK